MGQLRQYRLGAVEQRKAGEPAYRQRQYGPAKFAGAGLQADADFRVPGDARRARRLDRVGANFDRGGHQSGRWVRCETFLTTM